MTKEHVNDMLKTFPVGIKILFTYELENWQKSLHQQDQINKISINESKIETQSLNVPTTSVTLNLGEILNSTTTGTRIIDYYKEHNKLNNNIRSLLVDSIISYVITKNIPMSVHLA